MLGGRLLPRIYLVFVFGVANKQLSQASYLVSNLQIPSLGEG